jgi:hypothetical protein
MAMGLAACIYITRRAIDTITYSVCAGSDGGDYAPDESAATLAS